MSRTLKRAALVLVSIPGLAFFAVILAPFATLLTVGVGCLAVWKLTERPRRTIASIIPAAVAYRDEAPPTIREHHH